MGDGRGEHVSCGICKLVRYMMKRCLDCGRWTCDKCAEDWRRYDWALPRWACRECVAEKRLTGE